MTAPIPAVDIERDVTHLRFGEADGRFVCDRCERRVTVDEETEVTLVSQTIPAQFPTHRIRRVYCADCDVHDLEKSEVVVDEAVVEATVRPGPSGRPMVVAATVVKQSPFGTVRV